MVSGYKRFIHVVSSSNPIRARLPTEKLSRGWRDYIFLFFFSYFYFIRFLAYCSKRGRWKGSAGNDIISACFPAVNAVLLLSPRRFVTVKCTSFINSSQLSISYCFAPFSYFPISFCVAISFRRRFVFDFSLDCFVTKWRTNFKDTHCSENRFWTFWEKILSRVQHVELPDEFSVVWPGRRRELLIMRYILRWDIICSK